MKLKDIRHELGLRDLTPTIDSGEFDVSVGFASDLLSDVLAHAPKGALLVTVQAHLNVIAVAVHTELAGVVFASARVPEPAVVSRAIEENVPLMASDLSAFELVGRLYALGVRGTHA
jgi:hypothetical protein